MDKLIYTAFNTVNNIYDNRSVRAQNLANIAVPGYKRDLGAKAVGTAFLINDDTLNSRALAVQDDNNYFSAEPGTISETGVHSDIAIRGDGYFIVQGLGDPALSRRGVISVSIPKAFSRMARAKNCLAANCSRSRFQTIAS